MTSPLDKRLGGMMIHSPGVVATRALDEDRPRVADQPPDERPARKLGLRHEPRRLLRVQHEDVEPRDVVRDDQHVPARARRARPCTRASTFSNASRRVLQRLVSVRLRGAPTKGNTSDRRRQPSRDMQHDAGRAPRRGNEREPGHAAWREEKKSPPGSGRTGAGGSWMSTASRASCSGRKARARVAGERTCTPGERHRHRRERGDRDSTRNPRFEHRPPTRDVLRTASSITTRPPRG